MNLMNVMRFVAATVTSVGSKVIRVPDWPAWMKGLEFGLDEVKLEHPQAYKLIPDIYAAVSILQDGIAALPLKFYRVDANGDEQDIEAGDNPLVDLFRGGSPLDTGYDMMHSLVGHFSLDGNGYIFLDYDGVTPFNAKAAPKGAKVGLLPSGLWALPSHLIRPVLTKGRTIEKFLFYNGEVEPVVIDARQILHIPGFSVDADGVGLSPLMPLGITYHTSYDMERHNQLMFRRGGTVAGVYSTEKGIGPEERARVAEGLRVEGDGPENYFKPVLLPHGLKYERAALTHAEMQFFDGAEWGTQKVARVLKVPASLLGVRVGGLGASDKGLDADMLLLIERGLRPITRRYEARINEKLFAEKFGMPDVRVRFDYAGELALQQVFLNQAQAYLTATGKAVLTINDARKRLGLPPDPDPRSESLWAAEDAKAQQEMAKLEAAAKKPALPPRSNSHAEVIENVLRDVTDGEREATWSAVRAEGERWAEYAKPRVVRMLKVQHRRCQAALAKEFERRAQFDRTLDVGAILAELDNDADRSAMRRALAYVFRNVGSEAAQQVLVDAAFTILSKRAKKWLDDSSFDAMKNINSTTREAMHKTLAEVIGKGGTYADATAALSDVFGARIGRAALIARTESHAALNGGRLEGWRQAAEQTDLTVKKVWVTSKDEFVRGKPGGKYEDAAYSHYHADGQAVALDQPFFVGDRNPKAGEPCMSPGDQTLSAGNRINCRCAMRVEVSEALPPEVTQKSLALATSVEDILAR